MRHASLIIVAAIVVVPAHVRHATAQGLLLKQRHAAGAGLSTMRPLPAQAPAMANAATGAVSKADGATNATIAAVPLSPPAGGGVPGAVGGAPGVMPICIAMPAPLGGAPLDAMPMPMPSIDGMPPIACVDYPTVPPGFDPGATVSVGGWPDASGPPDMHHPFRGPLMYGRAGGNGGPGPTTAMSANAFGQATAATATSAAPGRAVAAGLPGRAIGVRPGTLDVPGRSQMAPIAPPTRPASTASAAAGTRPDPGVIQAAGTTPKHDGVSHAVGAGTPAAASAATGPQPRWRDRLRFAWPAPK
jgi:hypothetical protein